MRNEKMKRTSKKAYQKIKQKKDLQKEKERKEYQEKEAKRKIDFQERDARNKNSIWRKKLNWVPGCFQHFFDNFSQINKKVKENMLEIEDSINDLYQEIESRIDEIVEKVKDFDDHVKVYKLFSENGLVKHDIQHEWFCFQQYNLGKKMEKILVDTEQVDKDQDWYSIVEKIQERFNERFKGWWVEDYEKHTKQTTCIICQKEPNCLNDYNLSKKETKKMMF